MCKSEILDRRISTFAKNSRLIILLTMNTSYFPNYRICQIFSMIEGYIKFSSKSSIEKCNNNSRL